jgi:hypothetical protein
MKFLERLHSLIDPVALRILKWMNAIAGVVMVGLTAFSTLHPNFAAEVQQALGLSQMQGLLLGIVWCSLVAWIAKRAARS